MIPAIILISWAFLVGYLFGRSTRPNTSLGRLIIMYQLQADKAVEVAVGAVDKAGNPALVQGVIWTSSDETIFTVEQNPEDPMKAKIKPVGTLGSAQIQVSADADLGEGVETLSGFADIEIVGGKAVSLNVNFGTLSDA